MKYFPNLTEIQKAQFEALKPIYEEWNAKINVISRKDMDAFYTHHVLHSLAIAKEIPFVPRTKILDIGTGGGFPGIPLAIYFPECKFHLVDSIGKKIKVVQAVIDELALKNISAQQIRAEQIKDKYDFITARGVSRLKNLVNWTQNKIAKKDKNPIPNGLICLKGGDLTEEIKEIQQEVLLYKISNYFEEEFFETKCIAYVPL